MCKINIENAVNKLKIRVFARKNIAKMIHNSPAPAIGELLALSLGAKFKIKKRNGDDIE